MAKDYEIVIWMAKAPDPETQIKKIKMKQFMTEGWRVVHWRVKLP